MTRHRIAQRDGCSALFSARARRRCSPLLPVQPPAPLPLFAWAARQQRQKQPGPRLLLRDDLRDADGAPRACIAMPGRRLPLAFPNIASALAAMRALEAQP